MSHAPAKVTIDLNEYNELLDAKRKFDNPEGEISKNEMAEILGNIVAAVTENSLSFLQRHLQQEYNVLIRSDRDSGETRAYIIKQKER